MISCCDFPKASRSEILRIGITSENLGAKSIGTLGRLRLRNIEHDADLIICGHFMRRPSLESSVGQLHIIE